MGWATPEKARQYHHKYWLENKPRLRKKNRDWYLKNRERVIAKEQSRFREKLYGVTEERYQEMVAAQDGKCAVCDRPSKGKALGIDHDHKTNEIRGLLCQGCNWLVGRVEQLGLDSLSSYFSQYRIGKE